MSCSLQHDSTIRKQKLRKSSAHAKKVIDIPPNVSVEDATILYFTDPIDGEKCGAKFRGSR